MSTTELGPGHTRNDTHSDFAGVDPSATTSQSLRDTHMATAGGGALPPPGSQSTADAHVPGAPGWEVADAVLLILAAQVDDLEKQRIANDNRVRTLGRDFGLAGTDEVRRLEAIAEGIAALEHQAVLALQRAMRSHPLGPWVTAQKGLGDKTMARLLAAIGNPATRDTVSQLWAYSGWHVIDGTAARRRKGVRANWSNEAKVRSYLAAEACVKNRNSPYRVVYDDGRAKYADAVHSADCAPCKAKAGDPLRAGHQHARAMRLVAKAILRDLWREARRLHNLDPGQALLDTHDHAAGVDPSATTSQHSVDAQAVPAGGGTPSTPAKQLATPNGEPPWSTIEREAA
jgi:hypothetical protein